MCIFCSGYFVAHSGTAFIIRLLWKQFLMLDRNEIVGPGALWLEVGWWCVRRQSSRRQRNSLGYDFDQFILVHTKEQVKLTICRFSLKSDSKWRWFEILNFTHWVRFSPNVKFFDVFHRFFFFRNFIIHRSIFYPHNENHFAFVTIQEKKTPSLLHRPCTVRFLSLAHRRVALFGSVHPRCTGMH